jgi:hypothetical protein
MNGEEYDGEHEGQPNDIVPGNEFKRALVPGIRVE